MRIITALFVHFYSMLCPDDDTTVPLLDSIKVDLQRRIYERRGPAIGEPLTTLQPSSLTADPLHDRLMQEIQHEADEFSALRRAHDDIFSSARELKMPTTLPRLVPIDGRGADGDDRGASSPMSHIYASASDLSDAPSGSTRGYGARPRKHRQIVSTSSDEDDASGGGSEDEHSELRRAMSLVQDMYRRGDKGTVRAIEEMASQ